MEINNGNESTQEMPKFNPESFLAAESISLGGQTSIPNAPIENDNDGGAHAQAPIVNNNDEGVQAPDVNDEGVQAPEISFDDDFLNAEIQNEEPETISEEKLAELGKALGVDINSQEELDALKAKLTASPEQQQQQSQPQTNYSHLEISQENIQVVEQCDNVIDNIGNYEDKDIVAMQLRQNDPERYKDEEELEFQLENIKDSGLMKMQADTIRKTILDSAKARKETILNAAEEKYNTQRNANLTSLQDSIKAYKDGFHGIHISPEKALGTFNKVRSGELFTEIESSQANVAEMAMLWETRELIYRALENPSLQPGIKKIFNEMSNVQKKPVTGKQVLSDPTAFNPDAFMSADGFATK